MARLRSAEQERGRPSPMVPTLKGSTPNGLAPQHQTKAWLAIYQRLKLKIGFPLQTPIRLGSFSSIHLPGFPLYIYRLCQGFSIHLSVFPFIFIICFKGFFSDLFLIWFSSSVSPLGLGGFSSIDLSVFLLSLPLG